MTAPMSSTLCFVGNRLQTTLSLSRAKMAPAPPINPTTKERMRNGHPHSRSACILTKNAKQTTPTIPNLNRYRRCSLFIFTVSANLRKLLSVKRLPVSIVDDRRLHSEPDQPYLGRITVNSEAIHADRKSSVQSQDSWREQELSLPISA